MPPTLSPEPPVVSQEPSPGPKKVKRSRLGIFFALFLLLVLLIATFAWYLTTDSGIRHFVLPRISKAVGQKVRARAVHWSPLASIEMEDLQIGPDGSPLFEAKKLTVTYKPEGLRQRRVESIDCVQPVIRIEEKTSSSKSDLLDILKPETPASNENKSSRGAMDFHIGHLRVEDLNLSYITPQKTLFLQNVKFEGQNIQAGNNGIYDLDGLFSLRKSGASSEEKLAGRLQGHLEAQMDAELLPALVQGQITLAELHSSAKNDPWLGMSSSLQMNFSENELKQGTLSFQRGSEKLAAIHCSGPLDFKKTRGGARPENRSDRQQHSQRVVQRARRRLSKHDGQFHLPSFPLRERPKNRPERLSRRARRRLSIRTHSGRRLETHLPHGRLRGGSGFSAEPPHREKLFASRQTRKPAVPGRQPQPLHVGHLGQRSE